METVPFDKELTLNISLTTTEIKIPISDRTVVAFFASFIQQILNFRFDQMKDNPSSPDLKFFKASNELIQCYIPLSLSVYCPQYFLASPELDACFIPGSDLNAELRLSHQQLTAVITTATIKMIQNALIFLEDDISLQTAVLKLCRLHY